VYRERGPRKIAETEERLRKMEERRSRSSLQDIQVANWGGGVRSATTKGGEKVGDGKRGRLVLKAGEGGQKLRGRKPEDHRGAGGTLKEMRRGWRGSGKENQKKPYIKISVQTDEKRHASIEQEGGWKEVPSLKRKATSDSRKNILRGFLGGAKSAQRGGCKKGTLTSRRRDERQKLFMEEAVLQGSRC